MYQVTMAYAYWKNNMHTRPSVFDLFFRKNPFDGEFTLFAGLSEVIALLNTWGFTEHQIEYLKTAMPGADSDFFDWLKKADCSGVRLWSMAEGSVAFPRVPLLRVEGPLAVCQLLETTLLNIVNYPTLVATNAARMRIAAGPEKTLLEFGLRRAQGPDGAMTASRYTYMGGFDGTSNLLAGHMFGIPVKGTHAHSYVQSFTCLDDISSPNIMSPEGKEVPFVPLVLEARSTMGIKGASEGELAAFIGYAQAFPNNFLALVDTYDTLQSGVPNFLCTAWALVKVGYKPTGVRLDSGDLAYLSKETRKMFKDAEEKFSINGMGNYKIVASNDINEDTLYSLNTQGHEVDTFGIGTHLVTCQSQPALGAVYKLVELDGKPRIKISNASSKVSIPGRKDAWRLYAANGTAIADVLVDAGTDSPQPGRRFLCRHPFEPTKRVYVTPSHIEKLHNLVWDGSIQIDPKMLEPEKLLADARQRASRQLDTVRSDVKRKLNPTPYKVSVTAELFDSMHALWEKEAPVAELC